MSVAGLDSDSLELAFTFSESVVKGHTYRFRYRVKNAIGWSDFSDTTYILSASVPAKPPAPSYSSSTATSISDGSSPLMSSSPAEMISEPP